MKDDEDTSTDVVEQPVPIWLKVVVYLLAMAIICVVVLKYAGIIPAKVQKDSSTTAPASESQSERIEVAQGSYMEVDRKPPEQKSGSLFGSGPEPARFTALDLPTRIFLQGLIAIKTLPDGQLQLFARTTDGPKTMEAQTVTYSVLFPMVNYLITTHPKQEISEGLVQLEMEGKVGIMCRQASAPWMSMEAGLENNPDQPGTLRPVLVVDAESVLNRSNSDQFLRLVLFHECLHLRDILATGPPYSVPTNSTANVRAHFEGELKAYSAEFELARELGWGKFLRENSPDVPASEIALARLYDTYEKEGRDAFAHLLADFYGKLDDQYKPYYGSMHQWVREWLVRNPKK